MSNQIIAEIVKRNLSELRAEIDETATSCGRSSDSVKLVAVTKYAPWPAIIEVLKQGHFACGENRPQQLVERSQQLLLEQPNLHPQWHLIGQLQRNKVRSVLPVTSLIHSVDSPKLLERIEEVAKQLDMTAHVLLQVNVSGEKSKSGFKPQDVRFTLANLPSSPWLEIQGLMTMAPEVDDPAPIHHAFSGLRSLRDELSTSSRPLPELSMGMSGDFKIAIEHGATIVRVGSRIFAGCDEALGESHA